MRVLLVEDHFVDALLLTEWLEVVGLPWQVKHVETFAEATACWREDRFDALLLDLDLPDGFGLEVLGRALVLVGNAPVVVLSGLLDEGVAQEARELGARAYVVKGPAAVHELVESLAMSPPSVSD